jgi:hypothetical protein
VQVSENLDKAFLQEILRIVGVIGVSKANGIHFTGKAVVQLFLHLPVSFNASFD